MRLVALPVVLVTAVASAAHATAVERCRSTEQLAERVIASTATVLVDQSNGGLASGSGFFVGPDLIATNWHVVDGAQRLRVKLPKVDEPVETTGIVAADLANDLAIVQLKGATGAPLVLAAELPRQGAKIYAFGSPRLLEATMSDGIVSAERSIEGAQRLQITAAISPGSSGGPVTDECGRVVGVAYMTVRDSESLNFAIPTTFLRELLAKAGPPRSAAEVQQSGLDDLTRVRAERLGVPAGVDPERWVQVDLVTQRFYTGLERRELAGAQFYRHVGRDDLVKAADNTLAIGVAVAGGVCGALSLCSCASTIPAVMIAGPLAVVPVAAVVGGGMCVGVALGGTSFFLWKSDEGQAMSFDQLRALAEAHNAKLGAPPAPPRTAALALTGAPPPQDISLSMRW
ncbi:MAG: trypsin-like peptidase domain-containing protein [Deltaproteobacteria bacterium]|nr:trypsin-like peptidase domain-containing protein [Deltaproteobacteria bacterium]